MSKFYRIYWSKKFNWKEYARLYAKYCKTRNNYYGLSSQELIKSAKLNKNMLVVDLACGTGALTGELLKKYPKIQIIAIDISKDATNHYKKTFKKQIQTRQIRLLTGNAEIIHKYIKQKVDCIFIPSAIWDMNLEVLFKNLPKIMKKETSIITNLPSLTLGKRSGFIDDIESFFRKEIKIKKIYRRIPIQQLTKILKKNKLKIDKKQKFSFLMTKYNIKLFFNVLKYRYPFIFFSEKVPYKERYNTCIRIFGKLLRSIKGKGLKENGLIISIKK